MVKTIVPLAVLVAGVVSQGTFEPADFNITEALLDNGVNVAALPDLSPLVDRASTSGCSTAVSYDNQHCWLCIVTNQAIVQISQPYLWHRPARDSIGTSLHIFHQLILVWTAA